MYRWTPQGQQLGCPDTSGHQWIDTYVSKSVYRAHCRRTPGALDVPVYFNLSQRTSTLARKRDHVNYLCKYQRNPTACTFRIDRNLQWHRAVSNRTTNRRDFTLWPRSVDRWWPVHDLFRTVLIICIGYRETRTPATANRSLMQSWFDRWHYIRLSQQSLIGTELYDNIRQDSLHRFHDAATSRLKVAISVYPFCLWRPFRDDLSECCNGA